jgi:hypothetical protein
VAVVEAILLRVVLLLLMAPLPSWLAQQILFSAF